MTASRITYNVHAQQLLNHDVFMQHIERIQPTALFVMDALGLAREIKSALPKTMVIHRNWGVTGGDDAVFAKVSPQQWLDLRSAEAAGGIMLHTSCEPGWGQDVIDWHVKLMELAAPRGIPLVIGNWAVGTPQPDQWPMARRMLELLDQHRDLFVLGLHEYAAGVITSGLIGGAPDDPQHPNFVPVENWPDDVSKLTLFHCGRFRFLVNYCHSIGLRPPRIILSEHGFDDVSDIKPWLNGLRVNSPYLNIRGWKSLQDQWSDWYGGRGWSAQRAMFEQLAWADRTIYQNSPVEAQCIFCWGHTSKEWEQFDVAEAAEFHSLLEAYAQQQPAPSVQPVGQPAAPMTPIGFAPVGQPTSPIAPVGVAPVGEAAAVNSHPPAVEVSAASEQSASAPPKLLTISLTADEIAIINSGLRLMGKVTVDPTILKAFNTLADVLERSVSG
ncbi:MAG: hypothetical protein GC179_15930 [Anaerolineaceae bacterium]|nr:hypothetical protein [Anaerolineaceae bacterium]